MVTEEGLVVVVLVPVEGLDLQASALRVAADDARHGLVHVAGAACGVSHEVLQLLTHVLPAVHAHQLEHTRTRLLHTCMPGYIRVLYLLWMWYSCVTSMLRVLTGSHNRHRLNPPSV